MYILLFYKKLLVLFLFCFVNRIICQPTYSINFSTTNEQCTAGAAGILIDGLTVNDTVITYWSNNAINVTSITNLSEGDYFVHLIIKHSIDTTINFKIEKLECEVKVSNHFTPNGDSYNDYLQIANIQNYPQFELLIFNKWGQQIHTQKENYKPWDGTFNGLNVPDQTYYYVFYYDSGNKHKVLKGDITVLR